MVKTGFRPTNSGQLNKEPICSCIDYDYSSTVKLWDREDKIRPDNATYAGTFLISH